MCVYTAIGILPSPKSPNCLSMGLLLLISALIQMVIPLCVCFYQYYRRHLIAKCFMEIVVVDQHHVGH